MKTITTDIQAGKHAERISELGSALAREYDLADDLARVLRDVSKAGRRELSDDLRERVALAVLNYDRARRIT